MILYLEKTRDYICNKTAATAIEYALIAAGVALVIVAALFGFAGELTGMFDTIAEALDSAFT